MLQWNDYMHYSGVQFGRIGLHSHRYSALEISLTIWLSMPTLVTAPMDHTHAPIPTWWLKDVVAAVELLPPASQAGSCGSKYKS